MNIYDPLYGKFELSAISSVLATTPEVRRLSQIRLLNSMTPTLSTLGELRRYAHTLGVLHLFSRWRKDSGSAYTVQELNSLEVAIILHDVATPPFGHLFEYLLKEELGWDHESAAVDTLLQQHVQEDSGHQIFVGKTPKVMRHLSKMEVDIELVLAILRKQHPLHNLIFGSLDFDNIDNVWRMAWSLGIPMNPKHAISLASSLSLDRNGSLALSRNGLDLLEAWSSLRKQVYEVLIFDHSTVASQAVLTETLRIGLREGLITPSDWTLTDELLLERLMSDKRTRKIIRDEYLGLLPYPFLTLKFNWREEGSFLSSRLDLQKKVADLLNSYSSSKWHVYVFKERGSFSKRVNLRFEDGEELIFGSLSKSLIVYIFYSGSHPKSISKKMPSIIEEIAGLFSTPVADIEKVFINGKDVFQESLL